MQDHLHIGHLKRKFGEMVEGVEEGVGRKEEGINTDQGQSGLGGSTIR